MTGSDQVWGPISSGAYDLSYALEFAPEGARRISYAASFGKKNIPDSVRPRFLEDLRAYEPCSYARMPRASSLPRGA